MTRAATADVVHVIPKFSLLSNALASLVLGTAPLFAVLYWFTIPRGGMHLVAIANFVVLLAGALMLWRQLSVFCAVTETELLGNGIFSRIVRVPLADIHEVRLVPTFLGPAPEPVLQLLVSGDNDKRLFRMRGNFWHEESLVALAEALPVRVERSTDPMELRDFFRRYPGSAYWFEDRPALKAAMITLSALVAIAAAVVAMLALGLPVRIL